VTSDALCHTTALTQELQISRLRSVHPLASPCDEAPKGPPSRQDTLHGCLFKAATRRAQDAFDRIDAQSCDWTELVRDHCSFTRPSSAPFRATRACLPCPGRAAAPPYPAPPWLASRLTLTAQGRCFSPISATDIPIRAPVSRPIPALTARAAKSASQMHPEREPCDHSERGVRPPCGNPTPGGAALDGALQLRTNHPHPSLIQSRGGEEPRAQAELPWRGVISRAEGR
jgi:hypothetical protein